MTAPVLVFGHKNSDNDAICSAIGYAWLKNTLVQEGAEDTKKTYVPARLGPLPPETKALLEKWKIEIPLVVRNLYPRVSDVMTKDPLCVQTTDCVLHAGRLLRKHNIRALVVVDEEGTYKGLITTRMIAERYIEATDVLEQGASQMAVAADLIESLDQPVETLMEREVLILDADGRLDEATVDLMNQSLREAVVLDHERHPIGIVTRSDVALHPKREVILVDHNEMSQSATGIEEAQVLEIIDHHRVADISTNAPIKFINMPVGSTATIVTQECMQRGIVPPQPIAALLLSALMTDTIVMKSPTTTSVDKQAADYLGTILQVDPLSFGMDVFALRGTDDDMPIESLVSADSKEFSLGDKSVLIAQHETVNLAQVLKREQEIRAHMRDLIQNHGYEFVLFLVTDIIAEGSQFIVEGNPRIVNRAFDITCEPAGGNWLPGILSRKKQVVSRILES